MGRRAKPAKVKAKAKRSPGRKAPTKAAARVHELEQRLAESLDRERAKDRALVEALEHQTATAEILRVISSSPTDVQPVFDAIARSATTLCEADLSGVYPFDGELIRFGAQHGRTLEETHAARQAFPQPPSRLSVTARAILARAAVQVADVSEDREVADSLRIYRTVLSVPMMRGERPAGAVTVARRVVRAFSDKHIELLQTFADQAVIAVENVRLFTELQQKNDALTQANAQVSEALEQQAATSGILRVMSSSPTDIQPVFETIIERSVRLCDARLGALLRFDGQMIHLAAHAQQDAESLQALQTMYPMLANTAGVSGRALLSGTSVHVRDMRDDPELAQAPTAQVGHRTVLSVPMMREGVPIGVITVARARVEPFSDRQVELLQTFADQAVIAIENVRLFTELQTSNRDLTTALDTQTATADILRVISASRTDVQPVFDAIVGSAVRLLRGYSGGLTRLDGDRIVLVALTSTDDAGDASVRARFPQAVLSEAPLARAIRDRVTINIADAQSDPGEHEAMRALARARGYRSQVAVPLLQRDEALGALAVTRREAGVFTDDEIALLQTFADQAVIAIENVRLLTELQARTQDLTRSIGQLTALGEVGRAVSSTLDLDTVLTTIVTRAVQLSGLDGGVVFEYDEAREDFVHRAAMEQGGELAVARRASRVPKGEGLLGRTAVTLEPVQVPDILIAGAYVSRLRDNLIASGIRALLAVPMLHEGRLLGSLVVSRNAPGEFSAETVDLLRTFATQSALAIQNARLFQALEQKSRELQLASQHKSEFLANMSHELRTPLNAIIGFSDVLLQGMFGEMTEKQTEYLQDILASGQHLLSLINDILDLSKIEVGRMELDVALFDLPTAIGDAILLMRERAGRRGIALERHVDEQLGEIRADQRKVKQVLLNLFSNAVKFTPEGGRINVRASLANGTAEVSVTDTGVGIAPEHHEAVFEGFRQVGKADEKAEGTGLGLALCRKFVELHGGRIWVESQLGAGSTFTFTLPVSRSQEAPARP